MASWGNSIIDRRESRGKSHKRGVCFDYSENYKDVAERV